MSPAELIKTLDKAATKAFEELPKYATATEYTMARIALANMKSAIYEELLINK